MKTKWSVFALLPRFLLEVTTDMVYRFSSTNPSPASPTCLYSLPRPFFAPF